MILHCCESQIFYGKEIAHSTEACVLKEAKKCLEGLKGK